MQTPLTTREAWLTHFAEQYFWPRIQAAGGKRPERYRLSVGFPKGRRGRKGHAVGQCWSHEASADHSYEIFVSPELSAFEALDTLAHELIHAAVGTQCGHGPKFRKVAIQIGLTGPMRSTVPGDELTAAIKRWMETEAPYPHAPLSALMPEARPGSRLLKACCESCGYTVRVTRQWLALAHPICPDAECDSYHDPMAVG